MPWDVVAEHSRLSARYLRKEFDFDKEVKQATLYICGLGMYEAFINGQRVGEQVLAPAPTDYRRTVLYNAFDVTKLLARQNAIGVVLGNGRYYTMQQDKKPYKITNFGYPTLRLNLIVEFGFILLVLFLIIMKLFILLVMILDNMKKFLLIMKFYM